MVGATIPQAQGKIYSNPELTGADKSKLPHLTVLNCYISVNRFPQCHQQLPGCATLTIEIIYHRRENSISTVKLNLEVAQAPCFFLPGC